MLSLKIAEMNDADIITRIKMEAFNKETKEYGPSTEGGPPGYDSIDCTREGLEENLYYVIQLGREVIGSFWLHRISDTQYELEDFVMLPEFQNKGFGQQALELMEKNHPETKIWSLGTPHYSTKNHYLYEKMGYVRVGKSADNFLILFEKRKT